MTNNSLHTFTFDVNFGFGNEALFNDADLQAGGGVPPPPEPGFFLELQTGPFILLNNQDMTLL